MNSDSFEIFIAHVLPFLWGKDKYFLSFAAAIDKVQGE